MEDSILYRNVETLTLKRDKLLSKLRKQVSDLEKGRVSFEEVKETLDKLRRTRKVLFKSLEVSKASGLSAEYVEPLTTLLEFTLMVSVNDEKELLQKIRDLLSGEGDREGVEYVQEDLKNLEQFAIKTKEYLNAVGRNETK